MIKHIPDIEFDFVIIGSGFGGLACAKILTSEGYSVCVLEKNNQLGGNLQTYVRDKQIFDTGVHYVGSLDKGQPLYKYLTYLEIMDKLKLHRLDEDGYEHITFGDTGAVFRYGQGYDNFERILVERFPDEQAAIHQYCVDMKSICDNFPMYNAEVNTKTEAEELDFSALRINAKEYAEGLTKNKELQCVLMATNFLYAGDAEKTPLYVHAMVINSYMVSAYRFMSGGSQISIQLAKLIRRNGGHIANYAEVVKVNVEGEKVESVLLKDGRTVRGKNFISNMHPAALMDMLDTDLIRKAYRKRIKSLENTTSAFILNIILKEDCVEYRNYNIYYYSKTSVWDNAIYTEENWPLGHAIYFPVEKSQSKYVKSITVMAYMNWEDVKKWESSYNTVHDVHGRGEDYEQFKKEKAEKLIDHIQLSLPGIKDHIVGWYASTPLTYRDYIGTVEGSLYGVMKDWQDPIKTFISSKTRIPNLYHTGQNLHMHGIHGVAVSAIKTCSEILGNEYLMSQVEKANELVNTNEE